MKLWDKVKNAIHPDDDDGAFDDEFDDEYPVNGNGNSGSMGDMGDIINSGGYSSGNPVYGNPNQNLNNNNNIQAQPAYQPQQNVPPVSNISVSGGGDSSVELKVVKPENFDSVKHIADLLLSRKTVVLNLEETNKEIGRRLLDFLAGIAYAIKGDWKRVSEKTYIITPSNTVISAEQIRQETGDRRDGSLY